MVLKNFRVVYSGNSKSGYIVEKVYSRGRPTTMAWGFKTYEAACNDATRLQKDLNSLRRSKLKIAV